MLIWRILEIKCNSCISSDLRRNGRIAFLNNYSYTLGELQRQVNHRHSTFNMSRGQPCASKKVNSSKQTRKFKQHRVRVIRVTIVIKWTIIAVVQTILQEIRDVDSAKRWASLLGIAKQRQNQIQDTETITVLEFQNSLNNSLIQLHLP